MTLMQDRKATKYMVTMCIQHKCREIEPIGCGVMYVQKQVIRKSFHNLEVQN